MGSRLELMGDDCEGPYNNAKIGFYSKWKEKPEQKGNTSLK
jgi:hypothetical protein